MFAPVGEGEAVGVSVGVGVGFGMCVWVGAGESVEKSVLVNKAWHSKRGKF